MAPPFAGLKPFLLTVLGVVVEGFRSQEDKVLSGVPRGIVLGPRLFLADR